MRNPLAAMSSSVRTSFLYLLTVALGQGVSFFLLPIVTRYLTPEAYGQYSLALVVSSLVGIGSGAWIRNVGLRLHVDAAARGTSRGFFLSSSLLQAGLFTASYAAVLLVLVLTPLSVAPIPVLAAAGISQLLGMQFTYTTTLLRAEQRAVPFAVAEIAAGLIRFGATVAGLLLGFRTPVLLFAAIGLAYLLANLYATPALWSRLLGRQLFDAPGVLELLRAGPASMPFSLSGWLERLADRLVLLYFDGTAVVGIYSVGYAIGERLLGSLVESVYMVAWPSILNGWRDSAREGARRAIAETQRMYIWITVGPLVFLIVFGRVLVSWLSGPDFHQAVVVVPTVAASMWVGGYGAYLNRQFELNKRYGRLSGISLAGATINVILNFVLIPRYGMEGAAAATLINRCFNTAVFFVVRDRSLVRVALAPMGAAAALALAAWAASWAVPGGDVPAVAVFIVVYAAGALVGLTRIHHDEARPGEGP